MKLEISEWEYLIRITGGFLAPDKSAWYLVGYKWIRGKWKCKNPVEHKILEATNKTRKIVSLRYLKEHKAMFLLGMYLATYGNDKDQVKYIHKKATVWESSIIAGGLKNYKARKALNSITPQTTK